MTNEEFSEVVEMFKEFKSTEGVAKGKEYTVGREDRLVNFKEVADLLDITPLQAWAVYAYKHWTSIMNFVKDGKVHSEAIESRFFDLHTYLELGLAIILEKRIHDNEKPSEV